jgi:hypothetical protein
VFYRIDLKEPLSYATSMVRSTTVAGHRALKSGKMELDQVQATTGLM